MIRKCLTRSRRASGRFLSCFAIKDLITSRLPGVGSKNVSPKAPVFGFSRTSPLYPNRLVLAAANVGSLSIHDRHLPVKLGFPSSLGHLWREFGTRYPTRLIANACSPHGPAAAVRAPQRGPDARRDRRQGCHQAPNARRSGPAHRVATSLLR